MRLTCTFSGYSELSNVADFNLLACIWCLRFIFSASENYRVPGLSGGIVCMILYLAVLIQSRRVTDRQTHTHRPTHDDSIYRASIASRGKSER